MVVDTSNRAHNHNAAIAKQPHVYAKKEVTTELGTNLSGNEVYLFLAGAATWLR